LEFLLLHVDLECTETEAGDDPFNHFLFCLLSSFFSLSFFICDPPYGLTTSLEDDIIVGSCIVMHFFLIPNICRVFPGEPYLVEVVSYDILGVVPSEPLFSKMVR
jgi:hypothetical protein